MVNSELSDTSDDEEEAPSTLTPAQKAKITKQKNRALEEEEAAKLNTELKNKTRGAKATALRNKIWDTKQSAAADSDPPVSAVRKRTASNAAVPPTTKTSKKKKTKATSEDEMDIEPEPIWTKPAKKASKSTNGENARYQPPPLRKYLPLAIISDDDNAPVAQPAASKPPKTVPDRVVAKHARKTATSDDDAPSQSEDAEDGTSDVQSQSSEEDELADDITNERPKLIQSADPDLINDDLLDFDDRTPAVRHGRRSSTSSRGTSPPQSDFDVEDTAQGAGDLDREAEPVLQYEPPPRRKPARKGSSKTASAQQAKYEEEKPTFRSKEVLHAPQKKQEYDEKDWPPSARITFPPKGGGVPLLKQSALLQDVLHAAIDHQAYQLAFKAGYDSGTSRAKYASTLIRICAKRIEGAGHIDRRAKKDMKFCALLAPIICTRASNIRTELRNLALSKVATHYELNKPNVSSSQVRKIVALLLENQSYIFPYATPTPATSPATSSTPALESAVDSAVSGSVSVSAVNDAASEVSNPGTDKQKNKVPLKVFDRKAPFGAPAIVDLIREMWWMGSKALGFQHTEDLVSHRADRPGEINLPDPMLCLAGANIQAALLAYTTGFFVAPHEFSQSRLQPTYLSLLGTLQDARASGSKNKFNQHMHNLYRAVAQTSAPVAPTASGSASSVMTLDLDSD